MNKTPAIQRKKMMLLVTTFERIDKSELLDECDEVGSPLDKEEKESQESCIEKTE